MFILFGVKIQKKDQFLLKIIGSQFFFTSKIFKKNGNFIYMIKGEVLLKIEII